MIYLNIIVNKTIIVITIYILNTGDAPEPEFQDPAGTGTEKNIRPEPELQI